MIYANLHVLSQHYSIYLTDTPLHVQQKLLRGGVMWDPEVVILTAPRVPEEEFKFQKKVTTEDGKLKISTEIYEDVQ